jgi:hypothetical protein
MADHPTRGNSPMSVSDADLPPGLAQPAVRALQAAGCSQLDDVARLSEAELRQLHGIGPRAIATLCTALAERGLTFVRTP